MRPVNRKRSVTHKRQVTHKRSVNRKRLGTRKLSGKYKLAGGDIQMTEVITPAELITYLPSSYSRNTYNTSMLTEFMNMDHENEKVIWMFHDIKMFGQINILLTNYGKILYMINDYGINSTIQIAKNNYWIQTEDLPPIKILLKNIRALPSQRNELDRRDMDSIFENLSAYLTYLKNKSSRPF